VQVAATLVSPSDSFADRALGVAEPFGSGGGRRYAVRALGDLGARHVRDGVAGVDPARTVGLLSSGASLPYDSLVLAVGGAPIRPMTRSWPGPPTPPC
jgi:NADPH-dependent 2,4-dienoyl-CoA reductase/sulfur reductase-like enzyme